ncbi:SAM-dependent methyltransferase [Pseudomonas syringae]|uniref:methyltransferase domain-containing protein n=1 Tax=Pseudomonas syringae TaxID=317 RepID=UPI000C1C9947|nr:methyltransferase domain-containing protein [Pseudomonas syringae]PIO95254.1 SAM-dependent methyltransferase [Pseudomonas syringae]POP82840.1 methyltransferase domain-containing protein [Pseudomonas syringae]
MSIPFYRAFEDRYRGSRELIHERQQVYVPFLEPLNQLYPECLALDLGCGRGEWLEILVQNGFQALGIDIDAGMLEACSTLGLPVEHVDALEKLKSLPDESLAVVSGFHIAEHIPFDELKILVAEALRVLKPAGLLILETPNSENLVVGTQTFYLDPTHNCPIPHLLLSFLAEYSGFNRSQLLRLQESAALADGGPVDLFSVLHGVSPDYAIVAQKQAAPEQMQMFDAVFSKEYGLSLESLSRRYDARLTEWVEQSNASSADLREQLDQVWQKGQDLESAVRVLEENDDLVIQIAGMETHVRALSTQIESIETQIREATLRAELAESRFHTVQLNQDAAQLRARESERRLSEALTAFQHVQTQVEQLQQDTGSHKASAAQVQHQELHDLHVRLNDSLINAHHWWLKATAYEARIAEFENSRSWRITRPLRVSAKVSGTAARFPLSIAKRAARSVLARSLTFVLNRPGLRARLAIKARAYPNLFNSVRQFAVRHGVIPPQPHEVSPVTAATEASDDGFPTASPRVARVYSDLKLAFERKENR